ncbi:MAG: hypothetical protein CL910_15830 [Deltaproteobacteria bacterium]|nr:hypothetical protein [Deltaproteobacteria bacterium]
MQKTFSPSSLNCFENCPRQYYYRYIEKVPVESEGIEAFVGKRVHEVLERLYHFVDQGMVPPLPRVLYRYQMFWEEHFDADRIRIVRRDMDVEAYRASGVRCIENYYRRHYPFDQDETLGLERTIRFKLDPDGHYPIRGIIDRLVRARDGTLEIHDFKTGRRVPRQEELDRDRQLGLYELAIRREFDEPEIRLVWHYVLRNQTRVSVRSDEQRETLREKTALAIDAVRAEQEWRATTSGLCDWCEYRGRCPAFQEEALPQEPREAPEAAVPATATEPTEPQLALFASAGDET